MSIRIAFSPGVDAGIFSYGLAIGAAKAGGLEAEVVAAPLPALNDRASRGEWEATMISAAVYPYLRGRYVLARCGACFAQGSGPILAAPEPLSAADLARATIAVGDATSSATVLLQLSLPGVRTRLLPVDKIAQATKMGLADCALLARGDGDAFRQTGLCCVVDLGATWARKTGGLPVPLACMAIRSDLPDDLRCGIQEALRASIRFGLDHRAEALRFARERSGDPDTPSPADLAGRVGAMGREVLNVDAPQRKALEEFLRRGHQANLLPDALPLEFVADA